MLFALSNQLNTMEMWGLDCTEQDKSMFGQPVLRTFPNDFPILPPIETISFIINSEFH
jgi:hypothetical protein